MKKKLTITVVLFIGLLLIGCATVPTSKQFSEAEYGSYPVNYEEIVDTYYSQVLYDPYSAHYRITQVPYKGYFSGLGLFDFGYIVHVSINAKNRMGGYTGEKQDSLLIKNGVVINHSMVRN